MEDLKEGSSPEVRGFKRPCCAGSLSVMGELYPGVVASDLGDWLQKSWQCGKIQKRQKYSSYFSRYRSQLVFLP